MLPAQAEPAESDPGWNDARISEWCAAQGWNESQIADYLQNLHATTEGGRTEFEHSAPVVQPPEQVVQSAPEAAQVVEAESEVGQVVDSASEPEQSVPVAQPSEQVVDSASEPEQSGEVAQLPEQVEEIAPASGQPAEVGEAESEVGQVSETSPASDVRESGVMKAMDGTEQGSTGWYLDGEGRPSYWNVDAAGNWERKE